MERLVGGQLSDEAVGPLIGRPAAGGRGQQPRLSASGCAFSTGGVMRFQTRGTAAAGGLAEEGLVSVDAVVRLVRLAGLFTAASTEEREEGRPSVMLSLRRQHFI